MQVAQLRALLSKLPDLAEISIHDADTDWQLDGIEVRKYEDGRFGLYAPYECVGDDLPSFYGEKFEEIK